MIGNSAGIRAVVAAGVILVAIACGRGDDTRAGDTVPAAPDTTGPLAVTLGTGEGENREVTGASTTFTPRDTVVIGFRINRPPTENATLMAMVVNADGASVGPPSLHTLAPGDRSAILRLHPGGEWPRGSYRVEVYLEGALVDSARFEIRR